MTISTTDPTTAFIRLSELEHETTVLREELKFYKDLVKASGEDSAEQFIRDVHFLAVTAAGQLVQAQADPGVKCEHKNVFVYAQVGMAQCRDCGTNLSRDWVEKHEKEILAIADILGVSVPEEPLPLIPGLQPPKHQFTNDGC